MKTMDDMIKDAGEEFAKKIVEKLTDLSTLHPSAEESYYALTGKHYKGPIPEDQIIDWFYTPIPSLDNQSPYGLCKNGDHRIVEDLLNSYDSGLAF